MKTAAGIRQERYLIVGGGLSGGLMALALVAGRPQARVTLLERGARLGGNHTWSFHDSDLDEPERTLVGPLVAHRWSGYDVVFPTGRRRLEQGYATITSARFDQVVRQRVAAAGGTVITGAEALSVGADRVVLADGLTLQAEVVIDARDGGGDRGAAIGSGYQKFVGIEVEVPAGTAGRLPERPVLMDASVKQDDGFRFMYVLPFGGGRALFEDTVFSNSPLLDRDVFRARIWRYLQAHGLEGARLLREEEGVLPMPWAAGPSPSVARPLRAGMAGGWFHPGTGYSLPVAARLGAVVARTEPAELGRAVTELWRAHDRQARFARLLNRMLFHLVPAGRRWTIFARFFGLPPETIQRFFRLQTTARDRARVLCGRPELASPSPLWSSGPARTQLPEKEAT